MKGILVFVIFMLTVNTFIHYLAYRNVKRMHFGSRVQRILKGVILFNFFMVGLYMVGRSVGLPPALFFISSLAIGIMFALLVGVIIFELLEFTHRRLPLQPARRNFFKKTTDYGVVAFAAGYTGKGVQGNLREPIVKTVRLNQNLFAKPLRIVQISDLHLTEMVDEGFVQKMVERVNALNADLVAITGDIIDAKVEDIKLSLAWLGRIRSRYGSYFVTGNHEYYTDTDAVLNYLKEQGIEVLDNRSVYIEEAGLNIVGVPDWQARRFGGRGIDMLKATQKIVPECPVLFLAHQPKTVTELKYFKPHLTLSGHTHGGQIVPFNYLVRLQQPYVKGLHEWDHNRFIYVSSGTGYWGPPMRLGTCSEIGCIEWS